MIKTIQDKLHHSGIKGMKWGVRRYENEDGTLTPAGKARYYDNKKKKNAKDMSDDDLARSNKRLLAERQYNDLSGRSYKNRGTVSNALIKGGMTAVATSLLTTGTIIAKNYLTGKGVDAVSLGRSASIGLLSGAVGGLAVTVNELGGQTRGPIVNDKDW